MARRRKLVAPGRPQAAAPAQDVQAPAPSAGRPTGRRLVRSGGDPRVMQFREPQARARVLATLQHQPNLEATAFTHRPWFRGGGLTAMEAQRVLTRRSIKVAGICYTQSKRVVCVECTYERHERRKDEGWDQPIFEEGDGLFTCTCCGKDFPGYLEKWP